MISQIDRKAVRSRIRRRVRMKITGTAERPRLAVFRSQKHIYAQVIDDAQGRTLCQASTLDKAVRERAGKGCTRDAATLVGQAIAERLKESGVKTIVFDRGGFVYHGRIKALAEAARSGGLEF